MTPQQAWATASNLHRFDEWMTIFNGWKSPVPDAVRLGTKVSSRIKVKGFRNTIHWEVTEYDEPRRLKISGTGRGGVGIDLTLTISEIAGGSNFHLVAELCGALLGGKVGDLVARALQSDVSNSVENLTALAPEGMPSRRRGLNEQ